jgi:hypothetical protein
MAQAAAPSVRRLWQEIAFATAAKFLALAALYLCFFAVSEPAADPGDHLFKAEIQQ